MTHTFLSVFGMSKGKQSLSCSDIPALTCVKERRVRFDMKQRSNSKPEAEELYRLRFMRPKSPLLRCSKSRNPSCSSALNDIDRQLAQIKQKLSIFREQDMNFRERLDSLSISIDELASRSSIASTLSEASIDSDLVIMQDDDVSSIDEEQNYEDDLSIENQIKSVSMSFLDEVLSHIPAISVTPDDIIYEEQNCEHTDDLSIENAIRNISTSSFSDEVLSRIPAISVTPDDTLPAKCDVRFYLFNRQTNLTVSLPTC